MCVCACERQMEGEGERELSHCRGAAGFKLDDDEFESAKLSIKLEKLKNVSEFFKTGGEEEEEKRKEKMLLPIITSCLLHCIHSLFRRIFNQMQETQSCFAEAADRSSVVLQCGDMQRVAPPATRPLSLQQVK